MGFTTEGFKVGEVAMLRLVLERGPAIENQQILEEGFLIGENMEGSLKQNYLNSLSYSVFLERVLSRII